MKNSFTDEDVKAVIDFLNDIAKNYVCREASVKAMSDHLQLYRHMQSLIPKIEEHVLEVKQVITPAESKEE